MIPSKPAPNVGGRHESDEPRVDRHPHATRASGREPARRRGCRGRPLTNERSGCRLTRAVYPIPGGDSSNVLCVCDDVDEDKQEPDVEAAAVNLARTSTEAGRSQQERYAAYEEHARTGRALRNDVTSHLRPGSVILRPFLPARRARSRPDTSRRDPLCVHGTSAGLRG